MSMRAIQAALEADVTPSEKIVLIGLANHDGPGGCWPSIATLARYAQVTPRQVQRVLRRLADRGLVTVHHNGGGSESARADRRPNRYVLHLHGATSASPRERAHPDIHGGATPASPRSERGDIQGTHGVTSRVERGDIQGTHGVTPVSPEPSLNHPEPPSNPHVHARHDSAHEPTAVGGDEHLDQLIDDTARRVCTHRQSQQGYPPAGPGALRKAAADIRSAGLDEPARRWLDDGHPPHRIAAALADRFTEANPHAVPWSPGAEVSARRHDPDEDVSELYPDPGIAGSVEHLEAHFARERGTGS